VNTGATPNMKLFFIVGFMAIAMWPRIQAQTAGASPASTVDPEARFRVSGIMKRALARCYSVVDGETPDHRIVKGVTRISWYPPTNDDYAEIAKLGEKEAVPALAVYVTPDAKPGGFIQLFAVKFLASIGTPSTISPLGAALNTGNWQVARLSALDALGKMPDSEADSLIRSVLNDRDPQISERAKQIIALRNGQRTP
jgi:hypothetical protein